MFFHLSNYLLQESLIFLFFIFFTESNCPSPPRGEIKGIGRRGPPAASGGSSGGGTSDEFNLCQESHRGGSSGGDTSDEEEGSGEDEGDVEEGRGSAGRSPRAPPVAPRSSPGQPPGVGGSGEATLKNPEVRCCRTPLNLGFDVTIWV